MRSAAFAAALAISGCLIGASLARARSLAVLVEDINEQLVTYGVRPTGEIVGVDGVAFFGGCADDETTGCELWRSDGTAAGTVLVKDIVPGTRSSQPGSLTSGSGKLFFAAHGALWRSDGTERGTAPIHERRALLLGVLVCVEL